MEFVIFVDKEMSEAMEMTVDEARLFVRRWRRLLVPWPTPHSEVQIAKTLENSLSGLAVGPVPAVTLYLFGSQNEVEAVLSSGWAMAFFGVLFAAMLVANVLRLRCRLAREVLELGE